jgi:5-methylcytosine-specific restriction endonuclease McrA
MTITNSPNLGLQTCDYCQATYTPTRAWQKTCSYVCGYTLQNGKRRRGITNFGFCARCGESLQNKRAQAIYCSKTCKSMDHTFKHRGQTRVQGVAKRKEIYDRDSGTCYLCNKYLALSEVELDHLIPVAKNGTSEPSNLAVSCRTCNRARGARIGLDQLRKLNELRADF